MTNLKKVIKGLRCCGEVHNGAPLAYSCNLCPYQIEKGRTCAADRLFFDALALLKAQEPRVMTVEEILHLKFDDVVFFELSVTGVVISAIVIDVVDHMPDGDIGLIQFRHIQEPINNADLEYYGKTWRCWTSRPTDEQREAIPWE